MELKKHDIAILRELAQKYMEYASLPVQAEKRELWRQLNMHNMQKPMINIDQMPWNELDVDGSLICQVEDPYWRGVENGLRQAIYKWEHLPADMVLEPYIGISRAIHDSGYGVEIQEETRTYEEQCRVVSHQYHNLFEEPEDVEKIKFPTITVDRDKDAERLAAAEHIFQGIAPVQLRGYSQSCALWDRVAMWMGVENVYIELMDRPEFIHAIMDRYTSAVEHALKQVNELGVYDIAGHTCHCSYTYDDRLPTPACDPTHPTTYDGWACGMAQLFSSVSPAITEEFEVPYMKRLFSMFGSVYYGCCERLDDRLDIIAKMPNIRKISCSPWSDREHFAATLPHQYIMSNKPNPAFLAGSTFDEDVIRKDIRRTIDCAKAHGLGVEMLLKDISTVHHDPRRLWRWSEIALEETMR